MIDESAKLGNNVDTGEGEAFKALYDIIVRLRAPGGCPWDREQTPTTMRSDLLEEAYELVEAIDEGDAAHVEEEAGDLFLNTTMIAYMFEQEGKASVKGSLESICEKLIRRHPHVFGDSKADTSEKVLAQWAEIKEKVEGRKRKDSLLDEVSKALPTLERAYKIQKKAAKVGFDWTDLSDVWAKTHEELAEAEEALTERGASDSGAAHFEEEMGDLLFSLVNLSRHYHVDPSLALARANEKFCKRFGHVERRMAEVGHPLEASRLQEMDGYWNEAKQAELREEK